ncbi:MAG: response regulator [Candidatus Pacebacteria bacterium]|nr:response regulator [Candidatus Paceibacterota bacterium]
MVEQKKILIVEDDEHHSRAYNIKLQKLGFLTLFARDGGEALEIITANRPDVIILDLMLPKRDGFWVLEQLKRNPDFSKIPVIVLSNLGQEAHKEKAFALGAKEYLVKVDYDLNTLVDKVLYYVKEGEKNVS